MHYLQRIRLASAAITMIQIGAACANSQIARDDTFDIQETTRRIGIYYAYVAATHCLY